MNKIKVLMAAALITISSYAQHKTNTVTHTIKQGETISVLAKQYGVQIGDILQANNLTDRTVLKIGQKIALPAKEKIAIAATKKPVVVAEKKPVAEMPSIASNAEQHTVVAGESLSKIARMYGMSLTQIKALNNLIDVNGLAGIPSMNINSID